MSSTTYRGTEGLQGFRQMVNTSLVRQELKGPGANFAATVTRTDLDGLRLLQADIPALSARRGGADVRDGSGHVFLLLGGDCTATLHHAEGAAPVDGGHLTVIPASATFEVHYPRAARVVFAVLEPHTVATRHPWLHGPVVSVAMTHAMASLYRTTVEAALSPQVETDAILRRDLADVLLGVVTAVSRTQTSRHDHHGLAALRTRSTTLIQANLEHPDLSPRWLAEQVHCSLRQIHRAFAAVGTTPAGEIRRRRLQLAALLLSDPSKSVTEVAHRLGFANASHLSRRFSEHFGQPPTRWRGGIARDGTQMHVDGH